MIRAVLDVDILYALPLRDTLLPAAAEGCFIPLWSDRILDEAVTNLLAAGRLSPVGAASLRNALDPHFADALIDDYRLLLPRMRTHPKAPQPPASAPPQNGTSTER